jgi:hypothetical protein
MQRDGGLATTSFVIADDNNMRCGGSGILSGVRSDPSRFLRDDALSQGLERLTALGDFSFKGPLKSSVFGGPTVAILVLPTTTHKRASQYALTPTTATQISPQIVRRAM